MPAGHKIVYFVFLYSICCFIPQGLCAQATAKNYFILHIHAAGKDTSFIPVTLGLQQGFNAETAATDYIQKIPGILSSKGYPLASIDSVWRINNDFHILLYAGKKYNWIALQPQDIDGEVLEKVGFAEKNFAGKVFDFAQLQMLQERIVTFYERRGYPFASVYLDSIKLYDERMSALLKVDKSHLYYVDSIRVTGKINLNNKFLQRYLDIKNKSIYNREKLQLVDKRMLELPYVEVLQQSDVSMLGTGSVLNLYLQARKNSQVNVLLGFLPSANQTGKFQLTGDVNLDLHNLLGSGENFLVRWQQLQVQSPRLNLGFSKPYIFNSPFGFNFLFDLFKKDSSFINLNAQVGGQFNIASNQSGKLFVQWQNTSLLEGGVDTNQVKITRQLPVNIDVNAVNVGFVYEWLKTDYRFNPRKGYEINFQLTTGIKNIGKNNDIVGIKDPSFNYAGLYDSLKLKSYQVRFNLVGSHYFPLTHFSVLKAGLNMGVYNSPNIFRNELFQIGGYKLLRGFDEESIYATQYAVITAEYRYLIGLNSFLFAFVDAGMGKNKYQAVNLNSQYTGVGLGIRFETKAGLLNLSYAVGKRDNITFNLREASKLHFGYINYF